MNVLLVAPTVSPELENAAAEVQAVVNSGMQVTLLQGVVTQRTLIDELVRPRMSYDVLWLATHGGESGIVFSDGILDASALSALVRSAGFRLVFLNTCSSIQVANMVQQESSADVICTVNSVPDLEAYRTGSLFARHLFVTSDFRAAYEASKPGHNRTYLYLSSGKTIVNGEMRDLRARLSEMETAVRSGQRGKVHEIVKDCHGILDEVDERFGQFEERLTRVEIKQAPPFKVISWRVASAAIFFIGACLLFIKDFRDAMFVVVWVGVMMEIAIFGASLGFWYIGDLTLAKYLKEQEEKARASRQSSGKSGERTGRSQ